MELLTSAPDASRFLDSPNLSSNNEGNGNAVEAICTLPTRCEDSSLFYDMSRGKILIIFNHYRYKKTRHYKFVPTTREGTYEDVKRLEKTFRRLGFMVVTHHDWSYKAIMEYLSNVCKKDHSQTSCLAIAIMTHGKGGHVCASDRLYPVADITDLLRTSPSLVGKPKLFFVQACREGHTRPRAQPDERVSIPIDADCLVLYSTYEDYLSYRTMNGTWLMQALCKVIETHHASMDLVRMVALINKTVAAKCSSWGDKQMPVTELNLTKFLKL